MENKYFIGLDIGTDSVGYAVTDEYYQLIKRKGEPMWGVTLFDAANTAAERRGFRTARRRIDRRQQRVDLLNELFTAEISRRDPRFFIRRAESRLYRDETEDAFTVFNDPDFTDKDYYEKYPTVHHLIDDLMKSTKPHDVRLVYLACAWLVANRGHFLFDISNDDISAITDFSRVYDEFRQYLAEREYPMPWSDDTPPDAIRRIMTMNVGITRKTEAFKAEVLKGAKASKAVDESCGYNRDAVIGLLCGKKIKPAELFGNEEYSEIKSVSLTMADDEFVSILTELGEDGELLVKLRNLQDCTLLIDVQRGKRTISEAKVAVYEQHRQDLKNLKSFVKKYIPKQYYGIFREASKTNYAAYSYNTKSCKGAVDKKASPEVFCTWLKKTVKDIKVDSADEAFYTDMMNRLDTLTFLPKQKTSDNRVIPQQLYRYELKTILSNAESYLPFLKRTDESGLSISEKILSIFDYRIPYYVGPLCAYKSDNSWMIRKAEGKILPWNFNDKIDLDASEEAFIRRMTNKCTYCAGADVLPEKSLLYSKFTVLNEINNLKINGNPIPVDVKQGIYNEIFKARSRVTVKTVRDYLKAKGLLSPNDELSGVDAKFNSSLASYHSFKRLLDGTLNEADVERIIERAAYSEDRHRLAAWIKTEYPAVAAEDVKYITGLNLKGFGRLSAEFLADTLGTDKQTGECFSIIEALWTTNNNLMQLLSDRFTFTEKLSELNREYYAEHTGNLSERLDEMYVSNAVKRPIIRTLEICKDISKAMGSSPEKIFIEMARGSDDSQKGKRTESRTAQLQRLYKTIRTKDARELEKELASMGELAENRLQSDKLFLYYMQMGKCAYTGEPISLSQLATGKYNIEHIYPRAFVKDDSVLNNKVLVNSEINGIKSDTFPVPADIRAKMTPIWHGWKENGLITEEKYKRLTRSTHFTTEEKWSFINRQLVETRQSTKVVAELLREKYPGVEIVYVKAGLVSEFRQSFDMLKSRQINNLHHAKDAYLNIVVGNVYDMKFSKRWFVPTDNYSIKLETVFKHPLRCGKQTVWQGELDLSKVRSVMRKNSAHITKYAYCRKGGLFDQMPVKKAEGLVPLKSGLPTEKYGGYNKPAASFFALVRYSSEKKTDVVLMPVELMAAQQYLEDRAFAEEYAKRTLANIYACDINRVELLINNRPIKVNTCIAVDGLRFSVNGKDSGGKRVLVSLVTPLVLSNELSSYVKRLESFQNKQSKAYKILPDAEHDKITPEMNAALYEALKNKADIRPFSLCPGNPFGAMEAGEAKFGKLSVEDQVSLLMNILMWFGSSAAKVDFSSVGGAKTSSTKVISSSLSLWSKNYKDVRIIDASPSGLFEKKSENLLELL